MISPTRRGLLLAALILVGWSGSWALLGLSATTSPAPLLVLAVLARTVLQTGLFIVGHDAMHGVLLPGRPRLNHRLGALALLLYAVLPYGACRAKHRRHHQAPGSPRDPDFHAPGRPALIGWYGRFLSGYLRPGRLALLVSAWALLALATSVGSVLLLAVLPLLLSSLQLFLVGTVLPHRGPHPADDRHRAISLPLPPWLSLLACYHFGYHREHHAFPELAWHQLPACRPQQPRGRPRLAAPIGAR